MQTPTLWETIQPPGTFLGPNDGPDFSFYWDLLRLDPDGNKLKLEVELCYDDGRVWEAGTLPRDTELACGLTLRAGAQICLTEEEERDAKNGDQVQEWEKECFEASEDDRMDQAERESEFAREARCLGLIKSY